MKNAFLLFFGILISTSSLLAQEEFNKMDADGKRHGIWKKYHEGTKNLRYEGEFNHGKEVGTFKFYCEECKKPNVVKEFEAKSNVSLVKYYTESGKLVSQGKMAGKKRMGEWLYFQKKSDRVMTKETYVDGVMDGLRITYYPNGKMTEELTFNMGVKNGPNNYYSPEGVLIKKLIYANDKLQGPAEYYDANGNVTIKGQYKKGKKHGLWQYFKDGKVTLEETFPKPVKRG